MTAPARRSLLAVMVSISFAQGAAAQYGDRRPPPSLKDLKDVTVDGTVKGMQANVVISGIQGSVLQVETGAGHKYSVFILRESKLGLTGAAKPDFLKPGMLVSFNSTLPKDKKAEVETPPTELRILSPSDANMMGMFEDKETPDLYYVCATVRSYKDGKLTVAAGGKQVTVPVPSDIDIKVESADPALIRPGDSVKVMGKEWRAPKSDGNNVIDGQTIGQTIDVKLQDTLTAATFKKKPGGK